MQSELEAKVYVCRFTQRRKIRQLTYTTIVREKNIILLYYMLMSAHITHIKCSLFDSHYMWCPNIQGWHHITSIRTKGVSTRGLTQGVRMQSRCELQIFMQEPDKEVSCNCNISIFYKYAFFNSRETIEWNLQGVYSLISRKKIT